MRGSSTGDITDSVTSDDPYKILDEYNSLQDYDMFDLEFDYFD